jgi:hypothetical protein
VDFKDLTPEQAAKIQALISMQIGETSPEAWDNFNQNKDKIAPKPMNLSQWAGSGVPEVTGEAIDTSPEVEDARDTQKNMQDKDALRKILMESYAKRMEQDPAVIERLKQASVK